ncbi:unnamed protein product [Cyprideis torosa]|uniref:ATP-dependent RNA helicase n=1 Tax=Cyprideis torosa TaxID=163714 RepID=A0A7R8W512_9CRUS|nr:unnamed protein product [Cyprideis torosa]CAG0879351.1 unnamed protein product [Cyprideis torosa]
MVADSVETGLLLNLATPEKPENVESEVGPKSAADVKRKRPLKSQRNEFQKSLKRGRDRDLQQDLRRAEVTKVSGTDDEGYGHPIVSSLFTSNPEVPECPDVEVTPRVEGVFENASVTDSDNAFSKLGLHPFLSSNLSQMFEQPTRIQSLALPIVLEGKDALIKAQTGTGKTLVYASAIVHQLQKIRPKITRSQGVMAVVLVPTKELASQTYDWFVKLSRAFSWIVPGLVIGIEKRKSEKARIRKGLNILVTTPGRLLDHLDSTQSLSFARLKYVVVDEADLLLEMGFQQKIKQILQRADSESIETTRQTILLSATLTPAIERLACLTLRSPVFIDSFGQNEDASDSDGDVKLVTPTSLQHFFVLVPTKLRLVTLLAFLAEKVIEERAKVLVFFATQDLVDFHTALLKHLDLSENESSRSSSLHPMKLHGKMEQLERIKVFEEFRKKKSGLLLSTDVAARGLDLSSVHWVVQCSAPSTLAAYLHRSGRTGRIGQRGSCLLFLLPSEAGFLSVLQQEQIPMKSMKAETILERLNCPGGRSLEARATWLQLQAEHLVTENTDNLKELAQNAFTSYVRFYMTYPRALRQAFNLKELHLGHVAKSLALRESPSKLGHRARCDQDEGKSRRSTKSAYGNTSINEVRHGGARAERTSRVVGGQRVLKVESSVSFSEFDSGLEPIVATKKRRKK